MYLCVFSDDRFGLDTLSGSSLEKTKSPCQQPLIVCSSSSRGGDLWNPQSQLARQPLLSLCRSCLYSHTAEDSWVCVSCHIYKTLSRSRYSGPLAPTIFLSFLLQWPLRVMGRGCTVCVSVGVGNPNGLLFSEVWPVVDFCNGLHLQSGSRVSCLGITVGHVWVAPLDASIF